MPTSRAVIYCRVSEPRQGEKGTSLESQLSALRKLASDKGYNVIAEFVQDEHGTPGHDRPALDEILDLAEQRAFDVLLIYAIDRTARDVAAHAILKKTLKKHSVRMEWATITLPEGHAGDFLEMVMAAGAEMEAANFKERSLRGKRSRTENGAVLGGRWSLYGYRYVHKDGNGGRKYEIVESEAEVVRNIFHWYVEGLRSRAIARRLTDQRVPTRTDASAGVKQRGYGEWSSGFVSKILATETYSGVFYWNKTHTVEFRGEDGKIHKRTRARPRSDWLAVPVPAIISVELFETAERLRKSRKKDAARNTKVEYLMRARMRCERCGYKVQSVKRGNSAPIYVCTSSLKGGVTSLRNVTCGQQVNARAVDDAVWSEVVKFMRSPEKIMLSVKNSREVAEQKAAKFRKQLATVEECLADEQAERDRWCELYAKGKVPLDVLEEKLSIVDKMIGKHQDQKSDLEKQIAAIPHTGTTVAVVSRLKELETAVKRHNVDWVSEFYFDWEGTSEEVKEIVAYMAWVVWIDDLGGFEHKRKLIEALDLTAIVEWKGGGEADIHLAGLIDPTILRIRNATLVASSSSRQGHKSAIPFSLTISIRKNERPASPSGVLR